MAGRFDLAGVGPGDPELMTIKTMRAIKACQILVLPIGSPELKKPELEEGEEETFAKECLAYRIACEAEPETKKKLRLYLPMPMLKEKKLLKEIHDAGARKASELLEKGKNLVFLTIGDPTVYSTGIYIYPIVCIRQKLGIADRFYHRIINIELSVFCLDRKSTRLNSSHRT